MLRTAASGGALVDRPLGQSGDWRPLWLTDIVGYSRLIEADEAGDARRDQDIAR